MDVKGLGDSMWRRHGNPLSVWSRLLSTPLVFVPVWNRSLRQGLGVAAWFAANPWLFPEPRDQNAWAVRAIRGERRWAKERPRDAALAVQTVGAIAMLGGLFAAYRRRLLPSAASAVVVMLTNAWFLDRMANTYGADPEESPE